MTDVVLTPTALSDSVELTKQKNGKYRFRKQIAPVGQFDYKGSNLDLSYERLKDTVKSYKEHAFDQVPFQLAGANNAHSADPRLTEGSIVGLTADKKDGLVGEFELSAEGADIVRKNPQLGVSAKLVYGRKVANGQSWPIALEHVLGTLNPHVTGMSPWEEVNLSNDEDAESTTDMSEGLFTDDDDDDDDDDILADDAELAEFLASLKEEEESGSEEDSQEKEGESGVTQTIEKNKDTSSNGENDLDLVKLAHEETNNKVVELTAQLNEQKWGREADALVAEGVPPRMVELAHDLMVSTDESAVELSGGQESFDYKSVVRKILEEAKGVVELSGEKGHQSRGLDIDKEDEDFLKRALADLG